MQYPINLRFKIAALASQIYVTDASGAELFYIKQKLFKLRENIEIYRDSSKSELLYTIRTNKVIDFSAVYTLNDAAGNVLGSIKRRGARSILKASYDIEIGSQPYAHVREANPWTKVADALLAEVPILGILSSYMFHPKYVLETADGTQVGLLKKEPAFFEGRFLLEATGMEQGDEKTQQSAIMLLMMVALLERMRG